MSDHDILLEEEFPHKVSAEYDSKSAADQAMWSLIDSAGLPPAQVRLVQPHDPDMGRKLEPETRGVARTLVRSHVVLGLGALVLGLVIAAVLVTIGPALTRSSPVMTFIAAAFLFPVLGLMLAGAISLRPDHDPLIEKTRTASAAGHWIVVAHCVSIGEQSRAKDAIDHSAQTL
tara:strand:- start:833 stop:1354 length:522 start_codon:yes stop_codon:yes gene_type:complete